MAHHGVHPVEAVTGSYNELGIHDHLMGLMRRVGMSLTRP